MKKIFLLLSTLSICLTQGQNLTNADTIPAVEFSEISFKNSHQDYMKIHVNRPPENSIQINDDKPITEISPDQITTQSEIIILFKSPTDETITSPNTLEIHTTKKGLTATTEQLTITSNNEIINYVCWQNSKIAKSEQDDLDELTAAIPNLTCLNSEEIKAEGIIKKSQNTWQIINPEKKKKSKNTKPKTSKTSSNTTFKQAPITDITNLEIKTKNLNTTTPRNHTSEILIAAITIILSLGLILGTSKKTKVQP